MEDDMSDATYRRLARCLDRLPGGFPATDSGVELRILKRLFTPEEAAFAPCLTLIPEEARVIAVRAKQPLAEVEDRLERMAKKGLIYRLESRNGKKKYMAAQFVIGIWEFHVNDLDEGLIRDMEEYSATLLHEAWKTPQLRTVPVGRAIRPTLDVATYERAEELVRDKKTAAVAPCICRREKRIMDQGCKAPEDYCLTFGAAARYYVTNGLGRFIGTAEALDILKKADALGLVLQPGNAKDIVNICCCCGCCCGVLRNLKTFDRPADLVAAPFIAALDPADCKGCGVCVKRCQMDAITMTGDRAELDPGRCIGCGLCVSTCPTGSFSLVRKPAHEQPDTPKDMIRAGLRQVRARGKLSVPELVMMQVRSKADRLRAAL